MKVEPNFKGVIYKPSKTDVIVQIARRHLVDKCIKTDVYLGKLESNPLNTVISVVTKGDKTRLQIHAGEKTYSEGILNSPYRIIKKAFKHMQKLTRNHQKQSELTENMTVPKIG